MSSIESIIKVGTRSSNLALLQSKFALKCLAGRLPTVRFELIPMSSPGDEDRKTSLEDSPSDFFTQHLDHSVKEGLIDCAIHSAKDLPEMIDPLLDWFWLPWKEDPRDVIVLRKGEDLPSIHEKVVVGVSSPRRKEYAQKHFPGALYHSIRGNIEDRLAQLDHGDYDLLIMAGAALKRLNLVDRIFKWIPLSELASPEGQGTLALTYKFKDQRLNRIRSLFVKPAVFVGAGSGNPDYFTFAGIQSLQNCDVCLYDALAPHELLKKWCKNAKLIDVGKRSGEYKISRTSLDSMLIDFVRQGKKLVRLKGGDPGIFGRLAEELSPFIEHDLLFRVIPGVSSLNVATTGSGILLTRRGISRGFSVITPRLADGKKDTISIHARKELPIVLFMAVGKINEIVDQLISENRSGDEPATMIFGAGSVEEKIICGNLSNIEKKVKEFFSELPGLLVIGKIADCSYLYKNSGALGKKRILITASEELQDLAKREILNYGGFPIQLPLIKLKPLQSAKSQLSGIHEFDWVVLTSPSAARCFVTLVWGVRN